MSKGIKWLLQT